MKKFRNTFRRKNPRNYVIFYCVERCGKNFSDMAQQYNISYSRAHQIYAFCLEELHNNEKIFQENFKSATGFYFS